MTTLRAVAAIVLHEFRRFFRQCGRLLSTVYDRELAIARMMLVAPIRRVTVVVAKVISSAALAAGQGLALFLLVPVLGRDGEGSGLAMAAVGVLGTSFTLAAIGMLLASRVGSLENFAVVMNFVGFLGAVIGMWIAGAFGLPTVLVFDAGGVDFPVVCSIIGSGLLVGLLGLLSGRRA